MIVNMKGNNVTSADLSRATAHDEKLIGMFANYQRTKTALRTFAAEIAHAVD